MTENDARARFTFQSTLSVRRATDGAEIVFIVQGISIHALRKESDLTRSS